jgi:hypothetical protein
VLLFTPDDDTGIDTCPGLMIDSCPFHTEPAVTTTRLIVLQDAGPRSFFKIPRKRINDPAPLR